MTDIPLGPIPHHLHGPDDGMGRPYEDMVNLARGLMLFGTEQFSQGNKPKGLMAIAQAQVLMYALDMEPCDKVSNYVLPPEMFTLFEKLTQRGAEWYEENRSKQDVLDKFNKRNLN